MMYVFRYVEIKLVDIRKEVQCPICLGTIHLQDKERNWNLSTIYLCCLFI